MAESPDRGEADERRRRVLAVIGPDRVWSRQYITGLIRGYRRYINRDSGGVYHEYTDGWLGLKYAALDSGNPDLVLDCAQLEMAWDSITSDRVRLAVKLAALGLDEVEVGIVVGNKRGEARYGERLVNEGIRRIVDHERRKRAS